jgi:hypothetical protein
MTLRALGCAANVLATVPPNAFVKDIGFRELIVEFVWGSNWKCVKLCDKHVLMRTITDIVEFAKQSPESFANRGCLQNDTSQLPTEQSVDSSCLQEAECPGARAALAQDIASVPCGVSPTPTASAAPKATAGPWTCIMSQANQRNSVFVRRFGGPSNRTMLQCLGPDANKCTWFLKEECRRIADGEPEPHPSFDTGKVCLEGDYAGNPGSGYPYDKPNWCDDAAKVLHGVRQLSPLLPATWASAAWATTTTMAAAQTTTRAVATTLAMTASQSALLTTSPPGVPLSASRVLQRSFLLVAAGLIGVVLIS